MRFLARVTRCPSQTSRRRPSPSCSVSPDGALHPTAERRETAMLSRAGTPRQCRVQGGYVMLEKIDELLSMYDNKQISRRQLLGGLLMTSATAPLTAVTAQQE